ncbi:hypothetical protein HQ585_18860 [candidate division KSB1 bacterium]|nr:hypothetical protein [candidate division KSB1 bacterium]
MSPGVIRTIGIFMFAIAFVIIMIANNTQYDKQNYDRGLMLLNELSSRLANKYFYYGTPETLEELLFEDDWKDPWGTRFRYIPYEGYFLLWSAGPNHEFETLMAHADDALVFGNGVVESWTSDSLIEMLYQSNHAALAQMMFIEENPALKRASSRWAVANNYHLDINYQIR